MSLYSALRSILFQLDAETVHEWVNWSGDRWSLLPWPAKAPFTPRLPTDERLRLTWWGHDLPHPIGLAGGFDKNADHYPFLAHFGFSHMELGSVTLFPQPGNPRPRIFREPRAAALYNSSGFPGCGSERFLANRLLHGVPLAAGRPCLLGMSLGKMKPSDPQQALEEYRLMARRLAPHCSFLIVNLSSPNTPGLRAFQSREVAEPLFAALGNLRRESRSSDAPGTRWYIKVSPSLSDEDLEMIASLARSHDLDGLVATNTFPMTNQTFTKGLREVTLPACGLSGAPLRAVATRALARLYRASEGKLDLIGVGGISTGDDAYERIAAGASLLQIYTAFIYRGPTVVRDMLRELLARMERDGIRSLSEIRGTQAEALAQQPFVPPTGR